MRFEHLWLKLMQQHEEELIAPPLDVAFAWFVSRQNPTRYRSCLAPRGGSRLHPAAHQAFLFGPRYVDHAAWREVAGEHPCWPPPAPGSEHDLLGTIETPSTFAPHIVSIT
ncbi:hypothetical protein Vretifemale_5730 [Volvox reticuliferus]|uniref:Uncharacterized protein n=1 Tax=Volvox reticuliferus TaxID=1737510 RepID=A0A8J4FIY3_9CHLO|nr:hypothetical protein Vretifemale_5730 [Volvox reticuliferus]